MSRRGRRGGLTELKELLCAHFNLIRHCASVRQPASGPSPTCSQGQRLGKERKLPCEDPRSLPVFILLPQCLPHQTLLAGAIGGPSPVPYITCFSACLASSSPTQAGLSPALPLPALLLGWVVPPWDSETQAMRFLWQHRGVSRLWLSHEPTFNPIDLLVYYSA